MTLILLSIPYPCRHIVSRCGSSAHVPLKILIQHVCAKTPDRAEFRSKIRGVVCTLLGLFDDDMYKELVQWLVKYSRNVKASYCDLVVVCLMAVW